MMRSSRFALVATLTTLPIAACSKDAAEDGHADAVVSVKIATVTPQPFSETVGAIGVVAARPGHVADLTAPASTRVTRVMVAVGQHVAAGTQLVELDQTPFVGATRSAEAAYLAAQRTYERTKRLADEGIAPRKDVDQAETELERTRGDLANARRQGDLAVLRAPISGVVTRLGATIGAVVDPSLVLVEIADPSALDLFFTVSPERAGRIQPGAKVQLSAGQSASGEPLGVATVTDVGGVVDTASRGVTVRAQAPTTRRPLRIGETIFGEIVLRTRNDAIVVPAEALVPEGEGFKVFVVNAAGVAHARPVTVGARTDKLAEITSGLAANERVVTYGAYGIEDSARVVPVGARIP